MEELAARRGLVVVQPDFHGLFLEIQAEPGAWGFREIRRPALASAAGGSAGSLLAGPRVIPAPSNELAVPDARGFLWWDGWGHLTSAFHRHLAERALQALGEAFKMA